MGSKEVFLSSALTLITFLQSFILTCVEGQYQVIGSPGPIVAAPGDDVILPCHVEPQLNVERLTVEWSNPDLKPDPRDRLKRVQYVHLYRDSEEVLDMKLALYMRRTTLFTDDLKQGNISLKIFNVSQEDEGRFRCFIPKLKGRPQASIISLIINTNPAGTGTTEPPLDPRNLQTFGPNQTSDDVGGPSGRSRLILLVVFFVFLVLCVGSGLYVFVSKQKNQKSVKFLPSMCLARGVDGVC